jgi:putative addiction module killer protein
MYEILQTEHFAKWLRQLRDLRGQMAIARWLERAQCGLLGDVKVIGNGISEIRIAAGLGYRVYFTDRDGKILVLLAGGDKSSQQRDIRKAKQLVEEY